VQVILREELPNLGTTGDVVKVKPGYARNYPLPRGLAVEASVRNLQRARAPKAESIADKRLPRAEVRRPPSPRSSCSVKLAFQVRAGEDGKLFGSSPIRTSIAARRTRLHDRASAHPPRRADQDARDHDVVVHLGPDTKTTIKVDVTTLSE
jgi:large subunit ribosomal protein L9